VADKTGIEWADSTINLWIGCTEVSPACDNCYARTLATRAGKAWGVTWNAPPVRTKEASWGKIALYQRQAPAFLAAHGRPRRVFINSLSDFFDNQAEDEWRWAACARMEAAPDVIFILVTKRPQLVSRMVPGHWMKRDGWPSNVWMLTTAENQTEYDRRVPWLLTLPAAVLGVSMEPLLEIIGPFHSVSASNHERAAWVNTRLKGKLVVQPDDVGRLSWAIIGGESGSKARVMPSLWELTGMIGQLAASRVAVFVKQLSQREYPTTFKDRATFPRGLKRAEHPYHAN
jgi:protein gp37